MNNTTDQLSVEFLSVLAAYRRLTGAKREAVRIYLTTGDDRKMNSIARRIQIGLRIVK